MWSFGILLWELYSFGRVPYPRVVSWKERGGEREVLCDKIIVCLFKFSQTVEEVTQYVDKGYRMDAPDGCPDEVYNIMSDCWKKDPSQRPNFTRIEKELQRIPS